MNISLKDIEEWEPKPGNEEFWAARFVLSKNNLSRLEVIKLWLTALVEDSYKQGQYRLKADYCTGPRYCCLGVVCEVIGIDSKQDSASVSYSYEDELSILPERVRDILGFKSRAGGNSISPLTQQNDDGKSFEDLAEFIMHEPPGLFNYKLVPSSSSEV